MSETPKTDDWTFIEAGRVWPFVEDENCNVTGLGHQDKATFAQAVNDYDRIVGGLEDPGIRPSDIAWKWAIYEPGPEPLMRTRVDGLHVTQETHPDAVAVTTLWGQR